MFGEILKTRCSSVPSCKRLDKASKIRRSCHSSSPGPEMLNTTDGKDYPGNFHMPCLMPWRQRSSEYCHCTTSGSLHRRNSYWPGLWPGEFLNRLRTGTNQHWYTRCSSRFEKCTDELHQSVSSISSSHIGQVDSPMSFPSLRERRITPHHNNNRESLTCCASCSTHTRRCRAVRGCH